MSRRFLSSRIALSGNSMLERVLAVLLLVSYLPAGLRALCTSNEYCPNGWNVQRKSDGSATTCDPMQFQTKCDKPYSCVHSKCGMSFCCAHQKKMQQYKEAKELEADMLEASQENEL